MDRDTLRGVLAGGATFLAAMVALAALAAGPLGIIGADRAPALGGWLKLEITAGLFASGLAGHVARRVAGVWRAPALLATGVLVLGAIEASVIVAAASAGAVAVPPLLVVLAPFAAVVGVIVGGSRRGDLPLAGRCIARHLTAGRQLKGSTGYVTSGLVLAVAAVLAIVGLPTLDGEPGSTVVATALTLDFTVTVPALVYWFLVRSRRLPWIALLPAFAVGYLVASLTIPPTHHQLLDALRFVVIPAELFLVSWLVLRARRAFVAEDRGDFATRFRGAALEVLGHRIPAEILTTEVAILYHAFRPIDRRDRAQPSFTVYREIGYGGIVVGLTMAILVEVVALHALLSLWSPPAAWVLSGLSLYAIVWLIGDYRALRSRPVRLDDTHLALRVGLRWEADVPLRTIARVCAPGPDEAPPPGSLSMSVIGRPNVRVRLTETVEIVGLYGIRRQADELWLRVDRATELRHELASRLPNEAGAP